MTKLTTASKRPFGLLLCNYSVNQGAVVAESVNSFQEYSRYPYYICSSNQGFPADLDFDAFDFLVIHYSIIPSLPGFVSRGTAEHIRRFKGLKIQMIQDDYRMNQLLLRFIKDCGIDVIYTVAPPSAAKSLYSDQIPGLDVETYLTGYISNWLKLERVIPLRKRRYDVGYRGRDYPYWFGEPVIAKTDLAKQLAKKLRSAGLSSNISTREKDRIYGRGWVDFLRNCRAIFGVETDVHYIDPDGYVHHWYDTVERLKGKNRWDGKVSLDDPFFKEYAQPAPAPLAVIPPRVFETIAVRSANVLVEGEYSGIVKPWRHFIPVRKDFSNIADVTRALRDEDYLVNMISVTFAEIAQNRQFTYEGFADQIDATVARHMQSRPLVKRTRLRPDSERRLSQRPMRDDLEEGGLERPTPRNGRAGVPPPSRTFSAEEGDDELDMETLEKKSGFIYIGNPNLYYVENAARTPFFGNRVMSWKGLVGKGIRRILGR